MGLGCGVVTGCHEFRGEGVGLAKRKNRPYL